MISHKNIHDKLDYFYKNKQIPHIIFHGSSGSGKKTIVNQFIEKIYDGNRNKIKHNVMFVNCSHGKGIKFIREELKFFAKTNLQSNQGVQFKSIVLFNADSLTIDAQSALRRCIEQFSYNTRFFIIVENKHKLLNPILSRFCEIYVPEYVNSDGKIENLHKYHLQKKFDIEPYKQEKYEYIRDILKKIMADVETDERSKLGWDPIFEQYGETSNVCVMTHAVVVETDERSAYVGSPNIDPKSDIHILLSQISIDIYEKGYSCMDLLEVIENPQILMKFHTIKSEFRCEKLLILYMLDLIVFNKSLSV